MTKPMRRVLPEQLAAAEMGWKDFASHPANPQQRNTEAHARAATHLLHWHPRQALVALAFLPDGSSCKLDGHTRAYMWLNGMAAPPPVPLKVECWLVDSLEMAGALKQTYDNRHAANLPHDVLYGVLRQLGVDFQSEVLRDRKFLGAIRLAQSYLNPKPGDVVDDLLPVVVSWLHELRLFDGVLPTKTRFNTAMQGSALLLLRRYGDAALPFLQRHQGKIGEKHGKDYSAQEAFNRRFDILRREASKNFSVRRNAVIVRTALAGFLAAERDQWFVEGKPGLRMMPEREFQSWLAETRTIASSVMAA